MFLAVVHGQEGEDDEKERGNVDEVHVEAANVPRHRELGFKTRERTRYVSLNRRKRFVYRRLCIG